MRLASLSCLALGLLFPSVVSARTVPRSTVWLSHTVLSRGQKETMVVTARDLGGQPLPHASVIAALHIGKRIVTYHLAKTNWLGKSRLNFAPPRGVAKAQVGVAITIRRGFLTIPVYSRFAIGQPLARAFGPLLVSMHALPDPAITSAPVYLFVSAHIPGGRVASDARVAATVTFIGGSLKVYGKTNATGLATILLDTAKVRMPGAIHVTAIATWQSRQGRAGTTFALAAPTATIPPTPTPTDPPILSPAATATPVPTPTLTPANTPAPLVQTAPTPTPTAIPTYTPTAVPTDTPVPTSAPLPTATATPTPAPTNTPAPVYYSPAPTNTPVPVSTAGCPGSQNACIDAMLNIINNDRAQYGVAALSLNMTQSTGTGSCVGSYGHSVAMEESGSIWHQNTAYPQASWPNNVCVSYSALAENVGYQMTGNELQDLQDIDNMMMSEPYSPGCSGNHACNILNPTYRQVGIGIYNYNGTTWLTEDFIG